MIVASRMHIILVPHGSKHANATQPINTITIDLI